MFEREMRDLIHTPRWNVGFVRTIKSQNVVEHSYYVTLYARQIAEFIGWPESTSDGYGGYANLLGLVMYALHHDFDETTSSDIPMPFKQIIKESSGMGYALIQKWIEQQTTRRCGSVSPYIQDDVPADIKAIVKTADILEACCYLADEVSFGNMNVQPVLMYLQEQMLASVDALPCQDDDVKRRLSTRLTGAVNDCMTRASKYVTGKETIK